VKNTPTDSKENFDNKATNRFKAWLKIFGEVRTQILLWYLVLMAFFIAVAIPTIQQRLFSRIEARVRKELIEEMQEFQELLSEGLKDVDKSVLERLERQYKLIPLAAPQNREELSTIYEAFMSRSLPEDDTFFIAILDGKFYKSSPRALPLAFKPDSILMQRWEQLSQSSQGEMEVADKEVDSILYVAEPIRIKGEIVGVFVVAHTTAGERIEGLEALQVVVEVKVIVLAMALLLAWFMAGRLLAPLKTLTLTAQSINESELTKRIPVRGEGEISELTSTFNAMMDRLEGSFASQRDFINDAGHELRTPITIIRGHLELMGDDPQEQQETLTLVIDELDRMSRFVDDLLLLAKAERPDFLVLETVDIAVLTEELFTKATALAPRNWQLDTVAKGRMVADRQRLTQAVMNLAQNATQYTTEDGSIFIGSKITKNKVSFWVQDTGEGIIPADQERIFERFARAAASRRRSEGAGLGLSIVRAIAQAHYGNIFLKSKLGTGSTFRIVLPLEPPQEVAFDESNSHRRR
jgi:signal transduction histidine kinase